MNNNILTDFTLVANWIFEQLSTAWNVISSNLLLLLGFSLLVVSMVIGIFRLLRNKILR